MHQIRVHAAWSGLPLVGDKIYGEDEGCYLEFIDTGWSKRLENRLLMPRHALHAWRLSYDEPGADWKCSVPADLLSEMGAWAGSDEIGG
jgi:23S rRNA pseudouridine1911/1915/1917 synthase